MVENKSIKIILLIIELFNENLEEFDSDIKRLIKEIKYHKLLLEKS